MFRNSALGYSSCLLITLAFSASAQTQVQNSIALAQPRHSISVLDSTKEQDGLVGAVRRVRTEAAKLNNASSEGPREVMEITTYGLKGNRIENVSYPVSDLVVGKQEYKYDDRGNITEMTVRDDRGSIVSREAYDYEFDSVGNWVKMITSLVVFENGKLKREPIETTYRTISYYFTDEVAKIVETPTNTASLPAPVTAPAENLEQPNVSFSLDEADRSSPATIGDAPPLQHRPAPPIASVVETTSVALEPTNSPATNSDNAEPRSGRSRLLSLKRSPERELEERTKGNSTQKASTANAAPHPIALNPPATESLPVSSAPEVISAQSAAFALYERGLVLLDGGNLKDALGLFQASVKLTPSAKVYLSLGDVYLKLDKNNDAEKAFQQSVKLNPEAAEAQYGFGLASFRLKRFASARDAFKKATVLSPNMAKAHFGLGLAYLELGQLDAQTVQVRILEKLDKKLAQQLSAASPQLNYSCRNFVCQ